MFLLFLVLNVGSIFEVSDDVRDQFKYRSFLDEQILPGIDLNTVHSFRYERCFSIGGSGKCQNWKVTECQF